MSELENLRRWKSEATEVLNGWHRVFEALGGPGGLGELHYEAALVEVRRLRNAADERATSRGDCIGNIVDNLGTTMTIRDGDMVTDTVVIAKVVEEDGSVRLSMGWSEGMSWIERLGMLTAAMQTDSLMPSGAQDDDDE
jgi:hypothetical protein